MDLEKSQIGFFFFLRKGIFSSCMCNMFWVTIQYEYHALYKRYTYVNLWQVHSCVLLCMDNINVVLRSRVSDTPWIWHRLNTVWLHTMCRFPIEYNHLLWSQAYAIVHFVKRELAKILLKKVTIFEISQKVLINLCWLKNE